MFLKKSLWFKFFLKKIDDFYKKTSMKWISYQISTSYDKLYLINSGISGRERERERERGERNEFFVISVKYKEISWRVRKRKKRKVTSRSTK